MRPDHPQIPHVKRTTGIFSTAILLDIWETRVGRVLHAFGLDTVRTTILTLALVATVLPTLAMGYLSYRQNKRAVEARVDEQLSTLSMTTVREVSLWLREQQSDLKTFATSYAVFENLERTSPQTRQRLLDYLSSLKERFIDIDELMVVTPDERTVASVGDGEGRLHLPGAWMSRSRQGDVVLGEPMPRDSGLAATIEVALPIVSGATSRFLGVLGARLNLERLTLDLHGPLAGSALRLLIVRPDGVVIASSADPSAGGTPPTFSAYDAATMGRLGGPDSLAVTYEAPDGLTVLGVREEISGTGWVAIAEAPSDLAFAEISRLRNATVLLLLVLVLIVGSLAYGLGLLIVRPLERLSLAATRVASGDLEVGVPPSGGSELTHLAGVFNEMVGRLRSGRDELERLSVTDELTGLANRRHLTSELGRELVRSARQEHHAAILMLDVDHFKQFNDTHGHQAGDAVLKRLAETMRAAVRELDTVARYGGEEFLVILPETPAAEAARVAERIRAGAEKDRFAPVEGAEEVVVTVSIGYAVFPDDATTPDALITAADKALYASKTAGRNRVSSAGAKSAGKKR